MRLIKIFLLVGISIILIETFIAIPSSSAQLEIESPRKQMAAGVLAYNVKCKTDFVLILKAEDKSAACVTLPTAKFLIEKGWGEKVTKKIENVGNLTANQNLTQSSAPPIKNQTQSSTPISNNLPILTTVWGQDIPNQISQIAPYLRSSDVVDLLRGDIGYASQLKSLGVQVALGGATTFNLQTIKSKLLTLPLDNVDIIAYDYEPRTVPDFSTDQNTAISHFSDLYQTVHALNKRVWVNPVFSTGSNWDWGEVAKHTDILCLQVQNFEIGANNFGHNTKGMTLQEVVTQVTNQVKAKSPTTKLYFQFGAGTGQTPQQTINDINTIKSIPFDGVLLFSDPNNPQYVVEVLKGLGR